MTPNLIRNKKDDRMKKEEGQNNGTTALIPC